MEDSFRFEEAMQLSRTIQSLASLLRDETIGGSLDNSGILSALAISYSALFALYDLYCCSDAWVCGVSKTNTMLAEHSISAIKEVSLEITSYAVHLKRLIEQEGMSKINPFMIDCLYQAAANYA